MVFAARSAPARTGGAREVRSAHRVAVSCPFAKSAGDQISRGFYVSKYPAHTIHSVTLAYGARTTGRYTVRLTARLRRYDGRSLGSATETFRLRSQSQKVVFDFADISVPRLGRITFTQHKVSGPGRLLFYNVGFGRLGDRSDGRCPGVTETNSTRAPLSTFRRTTVGVTIRAAGRS